MCDLASVYDALQGRDTRDGFQAERSREETRPLLERGLDGLRCAVLGGYFTTWCDTEARDAVARVAKALDVQEELQFPDAGWRAPRRLSPAPRKGVTSTCPRFAASLSVLNPIHANGFWQAR